MAFEGYEALHQRIREIHHDRIARTKWFQPLGEDEEYINVNDARAQGDWEYPVIITEASLTFGECRGDTYCRCRGCKPPLARKRWPRWLVWLTVFWVIVGVLVLAGVR